MSARRAQYRVALVGLGPRGLFALERLLDRAGALPSAVTLTVTAFEPHPAPGAGPVYDPEQPSYLRMNFAAEMVDMWDRANGSPRAERRPTFVDWRDGEGGFDGAAADRYPPRAEVGAYLNAGLRELIASRPPGVEVELVPSRVRRLRRSGDDWQVECEDRDGPGRFDEVLLTTGHLAGSRRGLLPPDLPAIDAVYPIDRLGADRIRPGCRVALRGFALTFIDAALALTEGRGGRFQPLKEHPVRLTYAASGAEPARLLPFSRSGRPMLAKPDPDLARSFPATAEVTSEGRASLSGAGRPLRMDRDLTPLLVRTGERLLAACRSRQPAGAVEDELARLLGPRTHSGSARRVRAELERSLEVGTGSAEPDPSWALGEAWRSLYPAIVERAGGSGLAAAQWPGFLHLASEMERIAFGPPLVNAAKLLALIEDAIVDPSHCAGGRVVASEDGPSLVGLQGRAEPIDVAVDAVSPAPGARHLDDELIAELLADGHLRIPRDRRGIEIGHDAGCVGASGRPTPGLSALGRLTEDWVIGNDTLNRSLHPHPDGWAIAAVQRAQEVVPAHASGFDIAAARVGSR